MLEESGSGMLRLRNGQVVFDRFMEAGTKPISRAEIARRTGLSKPTVNTLVLDLETAGVVRCNPSAQPHGRIGRPAASYEVVSDAALVVGVDMGATKTIVGVADLLGDVIATEQIETPNHAVAAVNAVVSTVRRLLERLGDSGSRLEAACVGVPGVYRPSHDRVEMAPNLPGFVDLPIRAELSDRLGIDVTIENDVNLATVGEANAMATGGKHFAAISIGTGIGMGMVLEGALYRGAHGAAGEIGSVMLPRVGGEVFHALTLEDVASAPAIRKLFHRSVEAGRRTGLEGDADVPAILAAAARGDQAATAALDIAADAVAFATSYFCWVNDPTLVVFGGGVGSNPIFVEAVRARIGRYLTVIPEMVPSTLGGRAAFLGAISTALAEVRGSLVAKRLARRSEG
ncbi:MAG: ROK family transcriptional regulator [bacterium]|nr:ROK family transcriptional regulator [bacterium]